MATIKSYTDLEQSKKLAEILPLESADMSWKHYVPDFASDGYGISLDTIEYNTDIPCWSLAALLDVLPNASILLKGFDKIYDLTNSSGEIAKADNPVDACYEMILKLNELNLL